MISLIRLRVISRYRGTQLAAPARFPVSLKHHRRESGVPLLPSRLPGSHPRSSGPRNARVNRARINHAQQSAYILSRPSFRISFRNECLYFSFFFFRKVHRRHIYYPSISGRIVKYDRRHATITIVSKCASSRSRRLVGPFYTILPSGVKVTTKRSRKDGRSCRVSE